MNNLSSNQKSFIKLMTTNDEYERRGFELLLKRADFEAFFEALAAQGLFDPIRNPGPIAGDKPGYYRIPYWWPLTYLEAAAKLAGERPDATLADKVMGVIRSVSQWRDNDGKPRDNYNTWLAFARMIGLLPTSAVSVVDIDLLAIWLTGHFDRSMVGYALARDRCVTWSETLESPPTSLLSALSLLSCYLTAIDDGALARLLV